ncbi:sugar ABC transporter permease [Candidatus Aerophobetes bacterium]|nr:sugar ABC transporter permease [Candidatus Aerophobetes bacterium]
MTGFLGKTGSIRRSQLLFLLGVFIPLISLFILIRVIPIAATLGISFTNMHLLRPVTRFVGITNFVRLLSNEPFIFAFFNSLQYVGVAVPLEIGLGLVFALMLSRKVKFESFYETLYFIPYILPMVPAAIIWKWFYSPGSFGLANYMLESMGFSRLPWMTDPQLSLLATIGIHVWKNLGYFVIIFVVGLKNIPDELRDASSVDGANVWQTIRHIDLPLMKPIILFGMVMATVWSWSAFTEVYIMTQGTDISTGAEIQVLIYRVYQEAFNYHNMGRGAAISFVVFLVSLGIILVLFKVFKWGKE